MTYNRILVKQDEMRYEETSLFPYHTEKVWVSYDKSVDVTNCDGSHSIITTRVEKREFSVSPNTSTTDSKEVDVELECSGTAHVVLGTKPSEPISSTTISYEISNEIYGVIDCIPTLNETDSYTIVGNNEIELKYVNIYKISATTITNGDSVSIVYKREKCRHDKTDGDNFKIRVNSNESPKYKSYALDLSDNNAIHYSDLSQNREEACSEFIWYVGGKYPSSTEFEKGVRDILLEIQNGCIGITDDQKDDVCESFANGEIKGIVDKFKEFRNNNGDPRKWFQTFEDGKVVIASAFTRSEFQDALENSPYSDESGKYIPFNGCKYRDFDSEPQFYPWLSEYEECDSYFETYNLVGTVERAISQSPCDTEPGDSDQDCFPRVYLRVNNDEQVLVRERMAATQENTFRDVNVHFKKENGNRESVYYPDMVPGNQFDGDNNAEYPKIPWEIVSVDSGCNETIVSASTISGTQAYTVSTICSNDEFILYNAVRILSATSDGSRVGWVDTAPDYSGDALYSEIIATMEIQLYGECIESDPCGGKTAEICLTNRSLSVGSVASPIGGCEKSTGLTVPMTIRRLIPTGDECEPSDTTTTGSIVGTIYLNSNATACVGDKYDVHFTANDSFFSTKTINGDVEGTSFVANGDVSSYRFMSDNGCTEFTVTVYQKCGCEDDCLVIVVVSPAIAGIVVQFDDDRQTTGITNQDGKVVFSNGETQTRMANPTTARVDAGISPDDMSINDCDYNILLGKWGAAETEITCGEENTIELPTEPVSATGGCWTRTKQMGDTVLLRTREYPISLTPLESTIETGGTVTFTKSGKCSYDIPDNVLLSWDGGSKNINVSWKEKDMSIYITPIHVDLSGGRISISHFVCDPVESDELFVHITASTDSVTYTGGRVTITYFTSTSPDPSDTSSIVDNDVTLSWDHTDYVSADGQPTKTGGVWTRDVNFTNNDTDGPITVLFTATYDDITSDTSVVLLDILSLPPSDYFVFKYSWDETDGTDLDSLTIIRTDSNLQTRICEEDYISCDRTIPLSQAGVGFNGLSAASVLNNEEPPKSIKGKYYIKHGGDNRESGCEGAIIYWKNLIESGAYHVNDKLVVDIYANWYLTKGNGDMNISIKAYKGTGLPSEEEMKQEGYEFLPIGNNAVQVFPEAGQQASFPRAVAAYGSGNALFANIDYNELIGEVYSKVATLTYSIKDQTTKIDVPDGSNPDDEGIVYNNHRISLSTAQWNEDKYDYSNIYSITIPKTGGTYEIKQLCTVSHNDIDLVEYDLFGIQEKVSEGKMLVMVPWTDEPYTLTYSDFQSGTASTPLINDTEHGFKLFGYRESDGHGKTRACMKFVFPPNTETSEQYLTIAIESWVCLYKGDSEQIPFMSTYGSSTFERIGDMSFFFKIEPA